MITIDDLQTLYDTSYFEERENHISIKEKQRDNPNALSEVTFTFSGKLIYIKSCFLDHSKSIYRIHAKHLNFKKICDGAFIIKHQDNLFLIWVELKSGYNDVCKKAIFQLPVSYIKLKSHLKNFPNYIPNHYKELGIIISYSPQESENDNESIMVSKRKLVKYETVYDSIRFKYDKDIRTYQATFLNGDDFGLNDMNIQDDLKMKSLYIHHCIADSPNTTINLDAILDSL